MAEKKEAAKEVTAVEEVKQEVAVKPAFDMSSFKGLEDFKAKDGVIKGLENTDKNDLKIGVYQLLQTTSELVADEKASAGTFYNSMTKRAEDSVDGILLYMTKTRVLWKKPFKRGDKALCRSFDGKVGKGLPGGKCANCPKQQWGTDNTPPECREGYNWLGLDAHNGMKPFRFTAISSGVSPTKEFITDITSYGYDLFCFSVSIVSRKEKNEQGTFYVPQYVINGPVSLDDAKKAEGMLESYKLIFEEDVELDTEHNLTSEDEYEVIDGETVKTEKDPF